MLLEAVTEYGLFLAKAITFLIFFVLIISLISQASSKIKEMRRGSLEIKSLNDYLDQLKLDIQTATCSAKEAKKLEKEYAKKEKEADKKKPSKEENEPSKPKVFVLDFDGDIHASELESLRIEVTALLQTADKDNGDQVILRLESPGGSVTGYGLAAAQLSRIRNQGIPLTVCVDEVAASGGYMMACQANKIYTAPFAVVGSIGVVAQMPNFHRFLKGKDIDVELFTAGEYKRTVTVFGENSEEGREKFQEDLEIIHDMFKELVAESRPQLDIASVSTGEVWYGKKALDMNLIDEIKTSDEVLLELSQENDVFEISYRIAKPMSERFGIGLEMLVNKFFSKQSQRAQRSQISG